MSLRRGFDSRHPLKVLAYARLKVLLAQVMTEFSTSDWDGYWNKGDSRYERIYDSIAKFYRTVIIDRAVHRVGRYYFDDRSHILHAGCGSGATDVPLAARVRMTGLDLSREALLLYRRFHPGNASQIQGDLNAMPIRDGSFDGLLSIGVVEHFEAKELPSVFREHARVVRDGGYLILLWPPEWGLSVRVLATAELVATKLLRRSVRLHPPEPTLYRSKTQLLGFLQGTGLSLVSSTFGWRDLFTHQFVILIKDRSLN